MPDNSVRVNVSASCNIIEHAKCIYLTTSEALEDSFEGKFTRHWWRMSYIGQACMRQHGKTVGYILEGIFAIPHYSLMAIGNGGAALFAPFVETKNEKQKRLELESHSQEQVVERKLK